MNRLRGEVKLTQKVRVKNRLGLHVRPAAVIVKLLQNCKCNVSFSCRGEVVNARSLLSLLMLAARQNSKITITVEGVEKNAQRTMEDLVDAFESKFEE